MYDSPMYDVPVNLKCPSSLVMYEGNLKVVVSVEISGDQSRLVQ